MGEGTLVRVSAASMTTAGKVRQKNEDSYGRFEPLDPRILDSKGSLFIVADGMGGHRGGDVASRLAVEEIRSLYYSNEGENPASALVKAFQGANRAIFEKSQSDEALTGMGTTCTAMVILRECAYFTHVGDSRAYLFRQGALRQITEDHSLVGEMLRSGLISKEDARTHPQRNVITKSLGVQVAVDMDTPSTPLPLEDGDIFLLCSDGLTTLVFDEEIKDALNAQNIGETCSRLIDLANSKGGTDNITVQIVKIEKQVS